MADEGLAGVYRVTANSEPYADYVTKRDLVGHDHFNPLREACGLDCVTPPEITYQLQLNSAFYDIPKEKNTTGDLPANDESKKKNEIKMSKPQLEAVIYACQSHEQYFKAKYVDIPLIPPHPREIQRMNTIDAMESELVVSNEEEMDCEDSNGDTDLNSDSEAMDVDEESSVGDSKILDYRRGFFLGDGTGTGKTRILSCIISEHYQCKGRRCLWVTANKVLFNETQEVIEKFFPVEENMARIYDLATYRGEVAHESQMVIMFSTYRDLVDLVKFQRLEAWLGQDYDGLVLLDDVHLAKKCCVQGKSSTAGRRIMRIQYNYPNARVVYSTATAASEVDHLLLLMRLHLWGPLTAYVDEDDFKETMSARDLPGLELLAMEMKMAGVFVSRQISFERVKVKMRAVGLTGDFCNVYRRATQLWSLLCEYQLKLKPVFEEKYSHDDKAMKKLPGSIAALYQSCQSFFGSLMTSAKISKMDSIASRHLARNKSIVIGLQKTGETKFKKFLEEPWNKGKPFSNTLSILRTAMLNLNIPLGCPKTYLRSGREIKIGDWNMSNIKKANGFAKSMWRDVRLTVDQLRSEAQVEPILVNNFQQVPPLEKWPNYSLGCYIFDAELKSPADISWSYDEVRNEPSVEGYAKLYHELSLLLPINPLDEIRSRFENPSLQSARGEMHIPGTTNDDQNDDYRVSELTGRSQRYKYNQVERKWEKTSREHHLSIEMNMFKDGIKRVAVLSNAASTGFNLHSDLEKRNKQRRIHITLEIGWAPEQFLQQLGRTHRSGQKYEPKYYILKSPIAGEERYLAMMGRRLRYLGAVCQGHPEANPHSEFLKDDFFTVHAVNAINRALDDVNENDPRIRLLLDVLDVKYIPVTNSGTYISMNTRDKIKRFLNRIMVLPCDIQEQLYAKIGQELEHELNCGSVYRSLKVLPGQLEDVELLNSAQLELNHTHSTMYKFKIFRHATWESVQETRARQPSLSFYSFLEQPNERILAVFEDAETRAKFVLHPYNRNPEMVQQNFVEEQELMYVEADLAEKMWKAEVGRILREPVTCEHMRGGRVCPNSFVSRKCTYRWALTECIVVSGHMSEYARVLEEAMVPVQLGKLTYKDEEGAFKSVAGLLVCYENCGFKIADVWDHLLTYVP